MHLNGECVIRLRLPLPRLLLLLFVHLPLLLLVVAVVVVFLFFFSFVVVAFLVIRTFYACLRAIHVVVALFVVLLVVVVVLVVWHLALASSSGCSSAYSKQLHTPCMAVCVFVLARQCVFVFVCVCVHRAIRLATFVLVQARWPAVHTLKGLWRRCCCCCVGCGCALDSSCTHDENKKSRFFFTYHHQ